MKNTDSIFDKSHKPVRIIFINSYYVKANQRIGVLVEVGCILEVPVSGVLHIVPK